MRPLYYKLIPTLVTLFIIIWVVIVYRDYVALTSGYLFLLNILVSVTSITSIWDALTDKDYDWSWISIFIISNWVVVFNYPALFGESQRLLIIVLIGITGGHVNVLFYLFKKNFENRKLNSIYQMYPELFKG